MERPSRGPARAQVRRPSVQGLPPEQRAAAVRVAECLRIHGVQGWIVGGAVRDLARGELVHDVDMASAAVPEEIEAWFEQTVPVGKAFGTVLVLVEGREVQLTTFRSERGYSDRRRPDEVVYGARLEEDARRRDFTCNALYLDPLTDELCDPEGGLADLEAGTLRCVGDAGERFAEDGLRLLRLARFASSKGLVAAPEVLAAARAAGSSLAGVSAERVLQELQGIFASARPALAVELLTELGLLTIALFRGPAPPDFEPASAASDVAAAARLGALDLAAGLALLLADVKPDAARLQALLALKPSSALRSKVELTWRSTERLLELAAHPARASRAERIRVVRAEGWPSLRQHVLARLTGRGASADSDAVRDFVEDLAELAASATAEELQPQPLLAPEDLRRAGLPPGPVYGQLLRAAEDLQLEGALRTREDGLRWLAERAEEAASGGREDAP